MTRTTTTIHPQLRNERFRGPSALGFVVADVDGIHGSGHVLRQRIDGIAVAAEVVFISSITDASDVDVVRGGDSAAGMAPVANVIDVFVAFYEQGRRATGRYEIGLQLLDFLTFCTNRQEEQRKN